MNRAGFLIMALVAGAIVPVAAQDDAPPGITLRAQGHGWSLADAKGMSLYTYTEDRRGEAPTCDGDCIRNWPPLIAPVDAVSTGDWSIVTRPNGARQWAFRGKPLYSYKFDLSPGDAYGDEQLQRWYVALKPIPTPPGYGVFKTAFGYLLVDNKRQTLYTSDSDTAQKSNCNEECAKTWRPAEAWGLARSALPDWGIVSRGDGTRQWTFKGKPLYRFAGDFNPGEVAGDGEQGWQAVILEPPPAVPAWVTFQASDGGEVLADQNGKTLYAHDLTKPRAFGIGIARDMENPENWVPVVASATDKPVGPWSLVTREDGSRQWAHKGMPLYTHKLDTEPGDLHGVRSSDRVWRPIMSNGQVMPGTGN